MDALANERIVSIERAVICGRRPRRALYNGRLVGSQHLAGHGDEVRDPVVRLETSGGLWGLGWSRLDRDAAAALLRRPLPDLFALPYGATEAGRGLDLVLWDLAARAAGVPLYRLLREILGDDAQPDGGAAPEVEVYDGSIYIDDIGMSDAAAVDLYTDEVRCGQAHGFRHFKVKIGRGAYWMPTAEGIARDALVVHAVREAAGPAARIMIDANSANTVNTALATVRACATADVYWFEEPFHEDRPANAAFRERLAEEGYSIRVADGEGNAPPYFFDLVQEGLIDVVQQDLRAHGLSWWLRTAAMVRPWGALCAPHCWGSRVERYPHAHLAAALPHYALMESAPLAMPGLIDEGWEMREGRLVVPDRIGSGLDIDPALFGRATGEEGGYQLCL